DLVSDLAPAARIRFDNKQIDIAPRARVTARPRPEQDDPVRLRNLDDAPYDFLYCVLINHVPSHRQCLSQVKINPRLAFRLLKTPQGPGELTETEEAGSTMAPPSVFDAGPPSRNSAPALTRSTRSTVNKVCNR